MRSGTNWFRVALAAEQAAEQASAAAQQASNAQAAMGVGGTQPQTEGQPALEPTPTATPTQKVQQGKAQQAEIGAIQQVAVPDAANRALPALNESLHYLTRELLSRDDMRLSQDAARALAIEIMAAWLGASRQGTVSNLASIVVKSTRINAVLNTVQ